MLWPTELQEEHKTQQLSPDSCKIRGKKYGNIGKIPYTIIHDNCAVRSGGGDAIILEWTTCIYNVVLSSFRLRAWDFSWRFLHKEFEIKILRKPVFWCHLKIGEPLLFCIHAFCILLKCSARNVSRNIVSVFLLAFVIRKMNSP